MKRIRHFETLRKQVTKPKDMLYVLILRAKDNQSIKCVSVSTRCRITNRCCYAVDCVLEFQIMFFMFS
jgi:hypothetical protein